MIRSGSKKFLTFHELLRRPHADNPFPTRCSPRRSRWLRRSSARSSRAVYKPGDRLPPEQELAHLFSVSRPTVRPGCSSLHGADPRRAARPERGLPRWRLQPRQPRGERDGVHQPLARRRDPQAGAVPRGPLRTRVAVRRDGGAAANRHVLAKLEQIHTQIEVASAEPRRAFELDLQFHRALAEATLNPLILSIEGALIAVLHRMIGDATQTTPAETLANLTEIFDAVRDGRPDAAGKRCGYTFHSGHPLRLRVEWCARRRIVDRGDTLSPGHDRLTKRRTGANRLERLRQLHVRKHATHQRPHLCRPRRARGSARGRRARRREPPVDTTIPRTRRTPQGSA